jgi:hypothetical protein
MWGKFDPALAMAHELRLYETNSYPLLGSDYSALHLQCIKLSL